MKEKPTLLIISLCLILAAGVTSACEEQVEQRKTPTATIMGSSTPTLAPTLDTAKNLNHAIPTPSNEAISEILGQINMERVLQDLRHLTGEQPICTVSGCNTIVDRETGSVGLQWAKEYVYGQLADLGYSVELQDWSRSGYSDENIIARKFGAISPDEQYYFVAHLDGYRPDGADRAPAADDDASGVVGILETARVLSSHDFAGTLVFLITTGEEHGTLGARSHLDELSRDELAAIKYMVNVEMLGYDANGDGVMQLWSGDHAPSLEFAQKLSMIIETYELDLSPRIVTGCT